MTDRQYVILLFPNAVVEYKHNYVNKLLSTHNIYSDNCLIKGRVLLGGSRGGSLNAWKNAKKNYSISKPNRKTR